jgi:hypothetical protein
LLAGLFSVPARHSATAALQTCLRFIYLLQLWQVLINEPRCIGHLRIPVLDTKQFVEILPADSMVELRNCQHVLDGHVVPIFFAERRYAIRYALFPIGILFVHQDVVYISEYLLGDFGWQWTEKRNKS